MTQPLIIAIQQSDVHARKIQIKHARNRPLGRIENLHKYSPPQPVLSCRTVAVDVTGTRTYRARTNADIIEEQHKLIHQVYTNARNVSSAPAGCRSNSKRLSPRPQTYCATTLSNLQVQGKGNKVSRPATSHTYPSSRSSHSSPRSSRRQSPRLGLNKRPKTSGSPRRVKSATDSHLSIQLDPDLEDKASNVQLIDQFVRDQWHFDNHTLDEGQFVRGRKSEGGTSLDPKTGSQWLVFGGGQRSASAGVVDAFTGMKEQEYYSIDGSTGTQVARQMRPGDKISIGINGRAHSRNKAWSREDERWLNARKEMPVNEIPLCWSDQMTREDSIIVKASLPRQPRPPVNLCETKPVVFEKLLKEEPSEHVSKTGKTAGDPSYRVNVRTRSRVGLDGQQSHAPITNISIDSRGSGDAQSLTVDDILESTLQKHSKSAGTNTGTNTTVLASHQPVRGIRRQEVPRARNTSRNHSGGSESSTESATRGLSIDAKGEFGRSAISPPSTGRQDKEPLVVETRVQTPREGDRVHRAPSAGRPPPVKPLHKTGAATGASIGGQGSKADAEYIQISRQLHISRGQENARAATPPQVVVIHSVREHNKPPPTPEPEQLKEPSPAPSSKEDTQTPVKEDLGEIKEEVQPPNTPTEEKEDDTRYAFNIPTAGTLETDTQSHR